MRLEERSFQDAAAAKRLEPKSDRVLVDSDRPTDGSRRNAEGAARELRRTPRVQLAEDVPVRWFEAHARERSVGYLNIEFSWNEAMLAGTSSRLSAANAACLPGPHLRAARGCGEKDGEEKPARRAESYQDRPVYSPLSKMYESAH